MRCTGVGKQTELEFAYSLRNRTNECRGPLVKLRLQEPALGRISSALDCFDAGHALSRAADPAGGYEMCAAHWYDVSMVVGAAGEAFQNATWESLKTSIFIMTSKGAGWDYREMFNRFTSFYQAKMAGNI